jgi:asparagine synthase (glutamine-hydrolysing)
MCGIAGFVGRGDRSDLEAMTAALEHRGPDGEGYHIDETHAVFLGHRRLAIIDREGGHQPMWSETDMVGVIFNGEIYNHVELRDELEVRGHVFRSDHSDTEVLVHGYEEWGEDLPARLNGMFAFAIYDKARRRLFLARDRFGEKPLYYTQQGSFFAFASELTALIRHSACRAALSRTALQKLFAYGYIPAPRALYERTLKLPGGHSLTFELASGHARIRAYWQFSIAAADPLGTAREDALVDELEHLLSQSVRRRLISDVPLGIFLSGGLDSSTAVVMASQHRNAASIKTFTVGFAEPSFDESAFARQVASAIGTDHHEKVLDLDLAQKMFGRILKRLDEPLGDASILPTYLLADFARSNVTVALSGDGGDELFAGYDPFKALYPAGLYAATVPFRLHSVLRKLADYLPISMQNMSLEFKIRRALMGLSYPASARSPVWMSPLEPHQISELLNSEVRFEDLYSEAITLWNTGGGKNDIDRTLEFFTRFYLQDDILAKVDRACMMSSLESRAIFLDNDLVAFCERLPHTFKIRRGTRKYLLKKVMERYLSRNIVGRRKKGFGIPLAKWLRTMSQEFNSLAPKGVNSDVLRQWWSEHKLGHADHRLALFTALSLEHSIMGRPVTQPHPEYL